MFERNVFMDVPVKRLVRANRIPAVHSPLIPPPSKLGRRESGQAPDPFVNTGALAGWKGALRLGEPRRLSGFVKSPGKPLKRLTPRSTSSHRAKAPALMRSGWDPCGISRLVTLSFGSLFLLLVMLA